jgi:DNA-directed RNA polymerase specialized sigma24 family protein
MLVDSLLNLSAELAAVEPSLSPNDILKELAAYHEPLIGDPELSDTDFPAFRLPQPAHPPVFPATSAASTADSDNVLMVKFYAGDDRAFEILFNRKKYCQIKIARRYHGLEAAEIYDDAFMIINNTRTYDPTRDFDPWLWRIIRNCAVNELRRRTPVMVLVTPSYASGRNAGLPAAAWRIALDDHTVELAVPSLTLHDLQAEIRAIQDNVPRWKWAFDVVMYQEEGTGTYLQFRVYSNTRITLESLDRGLSLISPAVLGFGAHSTDMSQDKATEVQNTLLPFVGRLFDAIELLPAKQRIVLILCDLLEIPLKDAVKLLQAGQTGDSRRPPFGTVGRWRTEAKRALAEETDLLPIEELLHYMSCCYYDPMLAGAGGIP